MAVNALLSSTPLGQASERFFGVMHKAAQTNSKAVRGAALILVREIKLELSHPGTGTPYTRGGKKAKRSKPGKPPAVDTGVLRNTIDMEVLEASQKVRVGSGQTYAPYLEFGTDRMAPRPFMRTAFDRARRQMTDLVASDLRRKR